MGEMHKLNKGAVVELPHRHTSVQSCIPFLSVWAQKMFSYLSLNTGIFYIKEGEVHFNEVSTFQVKSRKRKEVQKQKYKSVLPSHLWV